MCALRDRPGQETMPHRMGATPTASFAYVSDTPANDNLPSVSHARNEGHAIALSVAGRLILGASGIGLIAAGAILLGNGG